VRRPSSLAQWEQGQEGLERLGVRVVCLHARRVQWCWKCCASPRRVHWHALSPTRLVLLCRVRRVAWLCACSVMTFVLLCRVRPVAWLCACSGVSGVCCVRCMLAVPQGERDWVLQQFKSGQSTILVATDVAARGLGRMHEGGGGERGRATEPRRRAKGAGSLWARRDDSQDSKQVTNSCHVNSMWC